MNQWIIRSAPLLALISGTAGAQIATPPPPAPAPTPPYVAPPPAPPPKARATSNVPKAPELPALPFESLAQFDKDTGKLLPLTGAATRLALDRNPMIDAETRVKVNAWLAHRDARLDQIVIDNLDIVEKVEGGAMEQVTGEDMKLVLKSLRELAEPLKPPGGDPSIELSKQGILTRDQAAFSQKIIFEYNKELTKERRAKNPPVDPAEAKKDPEKQKQQQAALIVFTVDRTRDGISETLWRYPALLAEASKSLDKTVSPLGLPADASAKLEQAAKALPANATDAARAKAMKDAMQSLTIDQRRELMRKTVALRPALPPLPDQPVKPADAAEEK